MKTIFRLCLTILVLGTITACTSSWQDQVDADTQILVKKAFEHAGNNVAELEKALNKAPSEQKAGVAFLIAHMQKKDLSTLSSEFILENSEWAYKARKTFPWAKSVPEDIFLNEVMPYASLDETRDAWRSGFYARFEPYVRRCSNIYEAIDSINKTIQEETGVEYNTQRSIVNISPFQAIEESMATCTGLSFLLVNAFRSVSIPARLAGTPMWTNMRGNHSWVEVWIDGEWYFTEYYPDALNKSWFLTDAGKADPENPIHWIYAVSYKPSDTHFPLVWDQDDTTIHAENVTDRYITLYQEQLKGQELKEDEVMVSIVLYRSGDTEEESNNRVHHKVIVRQNGEDVDFGYTPSPTDDLNRFLIFKLEKNCDYAFVYEGADGSQIEATKTTSDSDDQLIKLYL